VELQDPEHLWHSLDSYISSAVVLDETGAILYANAPYQRFMLQNGGDHDTCGAGANYFKVCQSVSGEEQDVAFAVAAGIRAVMDGQRRWYEANYPCHSPTEQRWFRMRVEPFADEFGARVLILHSPIAPFGVNRQDISSVAELLSALGSFKTSLDRHSDPLTPEEIARLRRVETALQEALTLARSRLH
jgi:hypothetical protein